MTTTERLIDALKRLYPAYEPGREWTVTEANAGPLLTWRGNGPTIAEVLAMPLPPVATCWQPSAFRDKFTAAELVKIHRLANSDDSICLLEINLFTASEIRSDSQTLRDGMNLLVARKVLDQKRADEIMTVA